MSGNVSDCSDDSFEIVSAESVEEPECEITSMYRPSVLFLEMFDVYPVDTDIVARVFFIEGYEKNAEDRVIIVPVAWESIDQGLCAVELKGNYVKFDVNDIPKTSADKFYQLCYSSKEKTILGVSAPFSFREVHEDELMEFQKEQNRKFWTFRSRFAVLMNTYWNSLVENKRTIDGQDTVTGVTENVKNVSLEDAATSTEPTDAEKVTLVKSEYKRLLEEYTEKKYELVDKYVNMKTELEKKYQMKCLLQQEHLKKIMEAEEKILEANNLKTQKMEELCYVVKESEVKNKYLRHRIEKLEKLLYEQKVKEANLESRLQEFEELKKKREQCLKQELENTKQVLEYMMNQKDERLKEMSKEMKTAHLYVYETIKSRYKKRSSEDNSILTEVSQAGSNTMCTIVQKSQSSSNVPFHKAVQGEGVNIDEGIESYQLQIGYENENQRKEHLLALRKIKSWLEKESLDGFEELRNELRTHYSQLERINRHLTSEYDCLARRYHDVETMYNLLRKELVDMEGKLASKTNEKVTLDKELEVAHEQLTFFTSELHDNKTSKHNGSKDLSFVSWKLEKKDLENQLVELQNELAIERQLAREQEISIADKEQNYATQLVSMAYENQKINEAREVMKNDYEMRLKHGAKEYARLLLKYQKQIKLSDHTYAAQ